MARGSAELDALGPRPGGTAIAVDLGAGFGMHAIPLARRGFSVLAFDTNAELLGELATYAKTLPIRSVDADLLTFRAHLESAAEVILCMGDTLTHLPSLESIESLFADIAAALRCGGVFYCTFRNYTDELSGENRFIPVRSDADRILTCFLEYADAFVTVHDIVHEREDDHWRLRVGCYKKLRLAPKWVSAALERCGFHVAEAAGPGGMIRLTARLVDNGGLSRVPT